MMLPSACANPAVFEAGPEQGPYGTRVTIRGSALADDGVALVFENGVRVEPSSPGVRWEDDVIELRVPTPARGAYALAFRDVSVPAGRFEPDRTPLPLQLDGELAPSDWLPLSSGEIAIARRAEDAVVIDFRSRDGTRSTTVALDELALDGIALDAVRQVALARGRAPGITSDVTEAEVEGFVMQASGSLTWFAASPSGVRTSQSGELLGRVVSLVDAARDETESSVAWVEDFEGDLLLRIPVHDGVWSEPLEVADPASRKGTRLLRSVGGYTWRVWTEDASWALDTVTGMRGALLTDAEAALGAPLSGDPAFGPVVSLGGLDDHGSVRAITGVSADGQLAVEACGTDYDLFNETRSYCLFITGGPTAFEQHERILDGFSGTLHYAPSELRCEDDAHRWHDGDPARDSDVLFPCATTTPEAKEDDAGAMHFAVSTAHGEFVLLPPL